MDSPYSVAAQHRIQLSATALEDATRQLIVDELEADEQKA